MIPDVPMTLPKLTKNSATATAAAFRQQKLSSSLPAFLIGILAGMSGLLFGHDTGVISGLLETEAFGEQFGSYWDNVPFKIVCPGHSQKSG